MSLVARYLEEHGIPTVVLGSARDIVEECGVPRFLFTDLPLGNPCGPPDQPAVQHDNVAAALGLLESAMGPRTTMQSGVRWPDDEWRDTFMPLPASSPTPASALPKQPREQPKR